MESDSLKGRLNCAHLGPAYGVFCLPLVCVKEFSSQTQSEVQTWIPSQQERQVWEEGS